LFFAAPLVEAVSDFTAGESLELLPVGTHRVGTVICYEIIYPIWCGGPWPPAAR
jgi:apolipoprotein N-acyltransferase